MSTTAVPGSEAYTPDNLLDRLSDSSALTHSYLYAMARERAILRRRLGIDGGRVLSVGCGWHPGRHLFPAPAFRLVGVDPNGDHVRGVLDSGRADEAFVGAAGHLDALPDASFEVVLYRLVMHHIAFQAPLAPAFAEAARLLVPGGAMVVIEPGRWHPVGLGLAAANGAGLGVALHGTPDDVPLSPNRLAREARAAGLRTELHAVTYSWRRLPVGLQRRVARLDALGSRPRAALLAHTFLLIARRDDR
jgi:SAM-dependent methyltransferase